MERYLTLSIALSLLAIVGIEVAAQAYSLQSPHDASSIIYACKGDKDDDCND